MTRLKLWFITILTFSEFLETFYLCTQSSFVPYSVRCGLAAIKFQSCYNLNRTDKLTEWQTGKQVNRQQRQRDQQTNKQKNRQKARWIDRKVGGRPILTPVQFCEVTYLVLADLALSLYRGHSLFSFVLKWAIIGIENAWEKITRTPRRNFPLLSFSLRGRLQPRA